jgi:hypothetical protein
LRFRTDEYLHIGIRDGSSINTPVNFAQDLGELLGKILHIDLNNSTPYSIPSSNPYLGNIWSEYEIWALGLRNPWEFSFDRKTGHLWINDVGISSAGEINLQLASSAGAENYGWRCYEGNTTHNTLSYSGTTGKTFPFYENSANGNTYALIGGFMYCGIEHVGLQGHYVFSDYCNQRIYSLYDNFGIWKLIDHGILLNANVTTLGEGVHGELYIAQSDGAIYILKDQFTGIRFDDKKVILEFFSDSLSGKTRFDLPNDAIQDIKICSLLGKEVCCPLRIFKDYIEADNLPQGLHVIEVKYKENIVGSFKFMVAQ